MIWHSCHQPGLSTKLPHMISVFKRSQTRAKKYKKEGKKLPNHSGQGYNPCFTDEPLWPTQAKPKIQKRQNGREIDNADTDVMVPDDIEHDFVKANHVYYVILSPRLEKSDKLITSCRGCNGKITLEEKKFLHNMVFRYRYYRKVPQGPPEQDMGHVSGLEELLLPCT